MKEGHPFATEELDRLRSRHRFLLRCVPDWIMERLAPDRFVAPEVDPGDEAFAEESIRSLIDAELEREPLRDFFTKAEQSTRAFATREVVAGALRTNDLESTDEGDRLYHEVASRMREEYLGDLDAFPGIIPRLSLVVFLMVIADQIADDGYLDPRIQELALRTAEST